MTVSGATFTEIADAIREKTGSLAPMKISQMAANIRTIQTGDGDSSSTTVDVDSGVIFIDHTGTELYSMSIDEAAELTSMPTIPAKEGLSIVGWNWSLADLKSYIGNHPDATVIVGAQYITDTGETRLYVDLSKSEKKFTLIFKLSGANATIDWGDGTDPEVIETQSSETEVKSNEHDYSEYTGSNIVVIKISGGQIKIEGYNGGGVNASYNNTYTSPGNTYSKLLGTGSSNYKTPGDHAGLTRTMRYPKGYSDVSSALIKVEAGTNLKYLSAAAFAA